MTPTKQQIETAAENFADNSEQFEGFVAGANWALQQHAPNKSAVDFVCAENANWPFPANWQELYKLMDAFAAQLQHLPRWIPVEERLPDESMAKDLPDNIGKIVEVLVSDGNYVFTDIFVIEVNRFLDFGSAVKFWMLRPTPPTK